jgi:hypothetical protein
MSSKSEKGRNTSTVSKVRSLYGMDGKKIVHCRAEDYRHAADGVSVLSHVRNLEKKGRTCRCSISSRRNIQVSRLRIRLIDLLEILKP